ncbi:aldolase [Earliella scabrosa]|nr:aldolase [Earliella scabrosa]
MSSHTSNNLLSHIRSRVIVDVDSMDPDVAARHTLPGATFSDMTSNQAIAYSEAVRPERADLVQSACTQIKSAEGQLDIDSQASNAADLLTVLLAKAVYPHLTGRVHAQTSPAAAYDTEATINHAKKLVSIFEANGIPKSRVCIKIPATPEAIIACKYLEQLGIRTLATMLFSEHQAMAAHQAGCLYIAPYFNELRVHFEPNLWKDYADPAKEHPMAQPIRTIVKLYKEIGSSTLVMPASIVTTKEVLALVSLNSNHITLSGGILDQLAAAPSPEGADVPLDGSAASVDTSSSVQGPDVKNTDYIANNAAALREAIAADAETTRKLADALKIFGEMETKLKELLRAVLVSES